MMYMKKGGKIISSYPTDDNPVSHPSHYTQGKIECIDFITDKELDFCRGNAIKYIVRAGLKNGNSAEQDINKAIQYLEFYKEKVLDGKQT